ncbi:MAG: ATP synthase F1 subunit delta [Planctomycetales bacterium]|nr:ATP synthase F1 subunit delta [Planctomycetales bacterium]
MTDSHSHDMDIDRQRLGATYAKALLGATGSENAEGVADELDAIVDEVLDRISGVEPLLASPRIDVHEKSQMVDRIFGGRVSDDVLKFLKVLNRHGRLDCLRQVAAAVRQGVNQSRGRIAVSVTTAEPVDSGVTDRIAEVLRSRLGSEVDLKASVNPALIGGLVVKIGDKVFDGSVANKLARLRTEAVARTAQEMRSATSRFAAEG